MSDPSPRWVSVIAIDGDRFVMVLHAGRAWEFPGGSVKRGESASDAARREFREETGFNVDRLVATREVRSGDNADGLVFVGELGSRRIGQPDPAEILGVGLFTALPAPLSFPRDEYVELLAAARRAAVAEIESPQRNPCCGNSGSHGEGGREYCSTCGQEMSS